MSDIEKELEAELSDIGQPTAPNADELAEKVADAVKTEELSSEDANPSEPTKEDVQTEPAKEEQPPEPDEEPKLILGKFKTAADLENAYVNLEKQFSKKSQQVSEAVKTFSSPDEFETQMMDAAGQAMIPVVEKALNAIANPEHLKEALFAWQQYKNTGDNVLLEKARSFLTPAADRGLQVDLLNKKLEVEQFYQSKRDEIELAPVAEELNKLEQEFPDWMKDETHQAVLIEAIKLNRKADIMAIKDLIDRVSAKAIENYKANAVKEKAQADEKKPNVSVKASDRVDPPETPKDWHKMTIEEQLMAEYAKK